MKGISDRASQRRVCLCVVIYFALRQKFKEKRNSEARNKILVRQKMGQDEGRSLYCT